MKKHRSLILGAMAAAALALAGHASAQLPNEITQARANGQIGEQANGLLGVVPGAGVPATLEGMVNQVNIQRRAEYRRLAQQRSVSEAEAAAAVACQVFAERIRVGERYRDENNQWRQRTASQPVVMPGFCATASAS